MPPVATFHTQLASIMEVLANTAVAEICELVDSGYAVLQLEISRSRKENEVLRRKLRLMELRTARTTALRAAATASGSALSHAAGRARVQLPSRIRPTGQMALCKLSNQESPVCRDISPPTDLGQETKQERPVGVETTAIIKVEDMEESWSPLEMDKGSPVAEERITVMDDSSPLVKHEAGDSGGSASCQSWTSGEVSSTSTSNQKTLHSSQTVETSSYDCALFEPQFQHGSQNPLGLDPGCSGMSASGSSSSFSYTLTEENLEPTAFHSSQQRALPPSDEQQLPVMQEVAETSTIRREGRQDGVNRGESGGKSFVCNYCGKALACFKNLKTHMRVHTGEKPFVCALCGKRFSDSSNLKRHQSVHTGEKRYGCVHCGKRFAQSGSLKVHMTVHTDYKQFMCSFCGKTFISSSHLRRHIALHTEEKQLANTLQ